MNEQGAVPVLQEGLSRVHFSSVRHDWETPPELMAALTRLFGHFDLDACATAATAKAWAWFGPGSPHGGDGLVLPWWGRTFVNPPYHSARSAYGLLPFSLLQQAELLVQKIALLSDGCGHASTTTQDGALTDGNELQRDLGLLPLGDKERQQNLEDIGRRLSVDPPSPRAALIELTRLLAAEETNGKHFLQMFNRRLVNHLDGQGKLIDGRALAWTGGRGVEFTIDTNTTLSIDEASGPGQGFCLNHDLIIPQLRGLINDIATAPAGTGRWLEKCHHEALSGNAEVVALIAARTDTVAWHLHVMQATHVLLLRGRLTFVGAANSAPFPSAVVNWRPDMMGNPRFSSLLL